MDIPEDFSGRLRLALKQANVSPAALGAMVGVDKSVVSRWITGRVRPNQHNLSRIADMLAQRLPGFSVLSFEAPAPEFRALLQSTVPDRVVQAMHALPMAHGLIDLARRETGRQLADYCGFYRMYYHAFSQPGRIARMALMLRPRNGLMELLCGAEGHALQGTALMMMHRFYAVLCGDKLEAMAFMVLNCGQTRPVRVLTGLLCGPSEGMLVPTASPVVLIRDRGLSGEDANDLADHLAATRLNPLPEPCEIPSEVRKLLCRATGGPLMQMPFAAAFEV